MASEDSFSFGLDDEDAPHAPIRIDWDRGFAAGASLRQLEEAAVTRAYGAFLKRFDRLIAARDDGNAR